MGTNCLIRCCRVLLVTDDQRSSFMTNGHLPPVGVRLSFVRDSLCSLYTDTLGVPFPPLGGMPPMGESFVRRPWFATSIVSK